MVEIKNLSAGYPGKPVLHNVTMTAPTGKVTAILGPNGCGKSTLLKAICGILPADGGEVRIHGEETLALHRKKVAQKVAYLPQSRQMPEITAERLVLHGRFPYLSYPRRYRPQDYAAAKEAMETMGIGDLAETQLAQLSGGQRQKVYIAMALAQDTPVILLDEPTTYLDVSHQLRLMRQARELTGRGKTVVMVVHDLSHAMAAADWVVLMENGRVVLEGTPEEVFLSNRIEPLFGIKLGRVKTENGWHYYCMEG